MGRNKKVKDTKEKPQELNKYCLTCTKNCKQYAIVEVEFCPKYEKKG